MRLPVVQTRSLVSHGRSFGVFRGSCGTGLRLYAIPALRFRTARTSGSPSSLPVRDPSAQHRFLSQDQPARSVGRSVGNSRSMQSSVLDYIRTIGIGMPDSRQRNRPKRMTMARKRADTGPRNARNQRSNGKKLLAADEEHTFFAQAKIKSRSATSQKQPSDQDKPSPLLSQRIPPAPFGNGIVKSFKNADTDISPHEHSALEALKQPVKILGTVTAETDQFPRSSKGLPEIAIAGRSNVGKSTLLNALLYGGSPTSRSIASEASNSGSRRTNRAVSTNKLPRGKKAKMSAKPGETRSLTFYQLSAKLRIRESDGQLRPPQSMKSRASLLLVDLPGYGFAYASETQVQQWQALMRRYILNRGTSLKRVLLLIDARHGMKYADTVFLQTLQEALYTSPKNGQRRELPPIQVVLTKCDLVRQKELSKRVVDVRAQLSDALVRQSSALPIMLVSTRAEGQPGLLELQRELASLVPL